MIWLNIWSNMYEFFFFFKLIESNLSNFKRATCLPKSWSKGTLLWLKKKNFLYNKFISPSYLFFDILPFWKKKPRLNLRKYFVLSFVLFFFFFSKLLQDQRSLRKLRILDALVNLLRTRPEIATMTRRRTATTTTTTTTTHRIISPDKK